MGSKSIWWKVNVSSYIKYLKIDDCKSGKGLISTVIIPADAMIMELSGPIIMDRDIPIGERENYLQIGPNTFLGSSGGMDDFINHCCNPVCKIHVVGNRAFLYSLYVIQIGMELTFDYATTSTDTLDSWQMNCKCGSNICRKVISGAHYLDDELFGNYKNKNMLPMYITEPGLLQKK